MALSETVYDLGVPLDPDDLSNEALYEFERNCARSGSAGSEDAVFAHATGHNPHTPAPSPQEQEQAAKFLMEAFQQAGMRGTPTRSSDYVPNRAGVTTSSDEEGDVFDYGVG
jgi:hypothetical protein